MLLPTSLARIGDVPIGIGRDDAKAAATRELIKPIYHRDDPTLLDRATEWLSRLVGRLIAKTVSAIPGGAWTVLIIIAVIAALVALAVWRRGAPGRSRAFEESALFEDEDRSAADLRSAADRAAASGDWGLAVQERFRAVIRGLEERTILERRPGRTADEAAAAAANALPALASELTFAADLFDAVTYGRREADAAGHERVNRLDRAARSARRDRSSGGPAQPVLAVPR